MQDAEMTVSRRAALRRDTRYAVMPPPQACARRSPSLVPGGLAGGIKGMEGAAGAPQSLGLTKLTAEGAVAAGVLATVWGAAAAEGVGRRCRGQGATGGVATADSHAGARGCYG